MDRLATISRECQQCGQPYMARKSSLDKGMGLYCGKPCFYAARAAKRPVLTCEQCGKSFTVKPHVLTDGRKRGRYCGKICMGIAYSVEHKPLEERFWEKVEKRPDGGCWIWTGARTKKGYGNISTGGRDRKDVIVTRLIWEWTHGPIPQGMYVCHDCPGGDNPSCVNPAHLFLGTPNDNMVDKAKKGRQLRGEGVPTSKLTELQAIEIKRRYRAGEANQTELALQFGVSAPTISQIVNGQTWKHLA